jgi:hypothetical protein
MGGFALIDESHYSHYEELKLDYHERSPVVKLYLLKKLRAKKLI